MSTKEKILYGVMAFFGVNAVFFIIGCAYGNPFMGVVLGWGVLLLGFCVIYPLNKLME